MIKKINFFDGYTSEIPPSSTLLTGPTDTVAISNNSLVEADVTGLLFDEATHKGFVVDYVVNRHTDEPTSVVTEIGQFNGIYNRQTLEWDFSHERTGDAGVEFSMTPNGQFQFISSDISGANYEGSMTYIISKTF